MRLYIYIYIHINQRWGLPQSRNCGAPSSRLTGAQAWQAPPPHAAAALKPGWRRCLIYWFVMSYYYVLLFVRLFISLVTAFYNELFTINIFETGWRRCDAWGPRPAAARRSPTLRNPTLEPPPRRTTPSSTLRRSRPKQKKTHRFKYNIKHNNDTYNYHRKLTMIINSKTAL